LLKIIEAWAGDERIGDISRRAVKVWYRKMAERTPAYAAATVRVLRIVLHFAKDEGYQVADLARMRLHVAGGKGEPWGDWEISAYLDEARRQSMALALMLGVCLGQREGDVLRLPRSGKPYKARYFARIHREICQGAGIPDSRWFMHLRHTAATRLGEAGCSDELIRAVTGHKSRGVVARYVRPTDTMARAAIAKLQDHRGKRTED